MAYHGYIPYMKTYLAGLQSPKVLEIGLDKGMTTIPLVVFLSRVHKTFEFIGVDILLQDSLVITLNNIDYFEGQKVYLNQNNSLDTLPNICKENRKFDLILIDGDHNYYTVKKELEYLTDLSHESTVVIIDDYHGRWADKDLWYSDRPGYEEVASSTKRVETEKQGVRSAVDEFLDSNPNWFLSVPIKGEPVMLTKRKL